MTPHPRHEAAHAISGELLLLNDPDAILSVPFRLDVCGDRAALCVDGEALKSDPANGVSLELAIARLLEIRAARRAESVRRQRQAQDSRPTGLS